MMSEIGILITFLVIFFFIFQKDRKDRERVDLILKTFDNTINNVLTAIEKTNNKFYEMVGEVQIEHFRQLQKHSESQFDALERQYQPFIKLLEEKKPIPEQISSLDIKGIENSIEKEDIEEVPLMDFPDIPMGDGLKMQIEGEERIYPMNISEI